MDINYRLIIFILLFPFMGKAQTLAPKPSPAPSGNTNTLSTFMGGLQSNIYFRPPRGFHCWVQQDSAGMFWFDSGGTNTMYYHNGTTRVQIGAGGGGSGTVTSITAGTGLTGGTITTSGTIRLDTTFAATQSDLNAVADNAFSDLADTAAAIRGAIPSVAGYATTTALADSVSGRQKISDTTVWDATRSWVLGQIPSVTGYVPYTGATDSVRLGEYQIRAGQVALDLTPTAPQVVGGMYWDATNVCPSIPLNADVTLQVGEETFVRARNSTGSIISNGSVVYINGAQGNNPTIALANADSVSMSYVIGVATEDIGINTTGFVTVTGVVNGVNTSGYNAGDRLYLSTTNGQITNTPPSAPHIQVYIGQALNSTNNGRIFVRPSQPLATDTSLLNGTTVAPTQYAVRSYVGYRQLNSDTSTFDATKAYVNTAISGKMNYTDTVALSNRINTKQAYSDTSTFDATRSWVVSQGYGTGTIKVLTGDVAASGSGTVTATLATVNANPATYTNASVTVDSKGRVTSASSGTAPVTSVSGTSGRTSSTGGTTPVIDLTTVNATPATYGGASAIPVITVDAYGRATTVTTVSPATNGTVTSIQLIAGTGVTITPTTAVTTSGTYTISATGSTGVNSVTSTNNSVLVSGTTTVNVAVDTTKATQWTVDQTIDSVVFGTGGGLSTNIKIGRTAFAAPTTATGVVAIGENAGRLVTTGQNDIYIGRNAAGNSGTAVSGHVGIGTGNLNYSTGDNNTAVGFNVMARAVAWNGIANVGIGINAGNVMTTATGNTFVGSGTAAALTSGGSNTFLGVSSGSAMTTGSNNIILGGNTGNGAVDIRTLSNRMILSDGAGNIRAYHNATNWLIGTVTDASTGLVQISGNLGLNTAGNKINIATGSNAAIGTATLVGGTVTVSTTAITASSVVVLTGVSTGAPPCATCGTLSLGTITAGSQFIINSSLSTDTRVVQYIIFN